MRNTRPWVTLAVTYIHISTVLSVHISRLTSPSVVLGGDPLTIDCDFDYQEEEQDQLDLKWYFNSSPFPIYQWVPSMNKGPQVIGELFKDNLDLLYSAHNDTFKKHRALHILNPDHRFSGTYMCKVSSFVDEDFQQKDILVIAPPRRVLLYPEISSQDPSLLNVTCRLEGMYPTPNVALSWTVNTTTYKLEDTETVVKVQANGLLNIIVSSLVERQAVEPEGALGCEITIPKTDFYLREELELFEYPKLLSRYTSSGVKWECSGLFITLVLVALTITLTNKAIAPSSFFLL